jgi:hypothetical protein
MITEQEQPLTTARKVLAPRTIEAVRRSPSFHLRGWKILDRWALAEPEKLRALEAQGETLLLERLLLQQDAEHETLSRNLLRRQEGMTEQEILTENGIPTVL